MLRLLELLLPFLRPFIVRYLRRGKQVLAEMESTINALERALADQRIDQQEARDLARRLRALWDSVKQLV